MTDSLFRPDRCATAVTEPTRLSGPGGPPVEWKFTAKGIRDKVDFDFTPPGQPHLDRRAPARGTVLCGEPTTLVEQLRTAQAATWLGDTPDVVMRTYVKPSKAAQAHAVLSSTNAPEEASVSDELAMTSTTGPAGLEPATPGLGAR